MTTQPLVKVAVLDDYQNVALAMADWSILEGRAEVTVFNDHLVDPAAVIARLLPFEVVCVMRERTPCRRRFSNDWGVCASSFPLDRVTPRSTSKPPGSAASPSVTPDIRRTGPWR